MRRDTKLYRWVYGFGLCELKMETQGKYTLKQLPYRGVAYSSSRALLWDKRCSKISGIEHNDFELKTRNLPLPTPNIKYGDNSCVCTSEKSTFIFRHRELTGNCFIIVFGWSSQPRTLQIKNCYDWGPKCSFKRDFSVSAFYPAICYAANEGFLQWHELDGILAIGPDT